MLARGVLRICLVLTLLAGCAPPPPNPYAGLGIPELEVLVNEQLRRENYSAAADIHRNILAQDPDSPHRHLRQSELLEGASRWEESVEVYRQALRRFPADEPLRADLALHLSFVYAIPLKRTDRAEKLLDQIPDSRQLDRLDLQALIAVGHDDPRAALKLLHQAAALVQQTGVAARLDFHSSLAYRQLGQDENLHKALFQAVTYSDHLGLSRMIADFWNEINGYRK